MPLSFPDQAAHRPVCVYAQAGILAACIGEIHPARIGPLRLSRDRTLSIID
jgi:hypothetical protein